MAKVKLDLKNLSDLETVQLANNIKTAMTGNANFATPVPPLTTIATMATAGQTGINNSEAAKVLDKQRTLEKRLAIDALKAGLIQLANYAVATVNGDAAKLASAGFGIALQAQGATPMPQVQNLSATEGDSEGEIDAHWDPIKNAHSYEIEWTATVADPASWGHSVTCTQSKYALTGLVSGTKLWFRVRAIGGNNAPGAWSDPATKMVP